MRRDYEAEFAPMRWNEIVLDPEVPWLVDGGFNGDSHGVEIVARNEIVDLSGTKPPDPDRKEERMRMCMRACWRRPEGWHRETWVCRAKDGALVAGSDRRLLAYEAGIPAVDATAPIVEADPEVHLLALF